MAEDKMTEREWRIQRMRGARLELRTCYCRGAAQVRVSPSGDISVFHFRRADPPERLNDGFYPVTECPFKRKALDQNWYENSKPFPPVGGTYDED